MNRPNLKVMTAVHASGILFDGKRAVGVSFHQGEGSRQERAEREVIVCAGAIGSPQLLMLSGVGPGAHIRQFHIPVVCDLPGVGKNLQDHPSVGLIYGCLAPISLLNTTNLSSALRYLCFKNGPLTSNVGEAGGFVKSSPSCATPDIQFHFGPGYFKNHGLETIEEHAFSFGPTLVRPRSTGSISLRSSNPLDSPRICANYFGDARDLDAMVEGIKVARAISRSRALAPYKGRELFPGDEVQTDAAFREYARKMAETLYHPVGTCRMGNGPDAVVDSELRVHGVDGLRVVDASIMPFVPGGNTNAPTIMVAEKAADLIKGRRERVTTTSAADLATVRG
jgi:choline dehydrogenase